ncbi:4'-phosphopantetheinyl transferase superfamily protein [Carboxylicivirga sp. RSCT41]|uniref:4'-phosphopantetheinyl transferase superfamily protein n=1 Tax=Carboxylicivirga agarovorans TaxID=3417570 RepID=UPI003D34EAC9
MSDSHKVAIWKIDESSDELLSVLDISESDKLRLGTFKLERRKKEWLAARLLLQKMLGKYPEILYGGNGKPQLACESSYISISHTASYAAISVSDKPTALDIEICSERVEKVADRFVHNSEWEYIDKDEQSQYCTVLWCAKEAMYKHFDVFGVEFKEQFIVMPFDLKNEGRLQSEFINEGIIQKLALNFLINEDFTLVYC